MSEFYCQKTGKQGVFARCKQCMREEAREKYKTDPEKEKIKQANYRKNNPLANRLRLLKYRYDITKEQYDQLCEKQENRCAICKTSQSDLDRPLDVDHCHLTGKVRGLLCNKCNQGIGLLKDNVNILKSAINYFEQP